MHLVAWPKLGRTRDSQLRIMQSPSKPLAGERLDHLLKD